MPRRFWSVSRICRENPWHPLFLMMFCLMASCFSTRAADAQADFSDAMKYALNQPSQLTPRAMSGLFTSVALAGDRLVAVGERGRIIISDDNGVTWRQVPTPTSVTLTHVTFATAKEGWAVGGMGIVMHSTDQGLTWTKQMDGVQAANIALAAAMADVQHSGANAVTTSNLQSAQSMVASGPSVPFLDVYAASPNEVLIAGAFGMAFSSTDDGANWQSLADFMPNPDGSHIYQILEDDGNFAVTGEQGLILYGPPGKPLAPINSPFQGTLFGEVFASDHAWIVFGLQGTILRSNDRGAHWIMVAAGAPVGIDCGIVEKNGDVLLGNIAGQLLVSHNNGQSFTVSTVNTPIVGLAQAIDGAIVIVGPNGVKRVPADKLAAGV